LPCRHHARVALVAAAQFALTACGGSDGGSTPPSPPPGPPLAYSIGGTVSGLDVGQSVVLQDNGGDDLTVGANGGFTFGRNVTSGGAYVVTVHALPPGKSCSVADGAGTVSAQVTNVTVACGGTTAAGPDTVGGTVSGLVGQGLTLAIYDAANTAHASFVISVLTPNGNGPYRTTRAPDGYGVLIHDQPHSPKQQCVVRHPWGSYLFQLQGLPNDVAGVDVVCGEFSYLTDAANGTISPFAVDASTGALASAGSPVSTGSSPASIAMSGDKRYLYVAHSASNDVAAFTIDPGNGTLQPIPGSPAAAGTNPRALAHYVGVRLSYGPPVITEYLYVANAGSNDLSVFRIDSDTGVLVPLAPASYPAGSAPSALVIDNPNTPDALLGSFLYVANSGGATGISGFTIDPNSPGPTPIAGSPFPSSGSVSSFALGSGGQFLYAAIASGSTATIAGFNVDPNTGALASLPGFPLALPSCRYIVADQAGAYLYAAGGTNVFGYSIDQKTGALDPLPGFPVGVGAEADTLSVDPTNQFLYVANGSARAVTGFALDAATGALTPMPGSPFAVGASADLIATF
jgi:6-phosphogluconolactonase (cycloisomerase 2 family)